MILKNITANSLTLGLSPSILVTIASGASVTVADEPTAIATALAFQLAGQIQITAGPGASQMVTPVSVAGYRDVYLNTVANTNTLTVSGTGTDGSTFSVVFEFVTALPATTGDVGVLLGANTAAAAVNLKAAINANATLQKYGITATAAVELTTATVHVILECRNATLLPVASLTLADTGGTITLGAAVAAVSNVAKAVSFSSFHPATNGGTNLLVTGLNVIQNYVFQVITSAGAIKPFDGDVFVDASGGTIAFVGGTSDLLATTDTVTVVAFGTISGV